MNGKISFGFVVFLLVLLFSPFVMAQPPFQTSGESATEGFTIEYPGIDKVAQNDVFRPHFHVYNITTGQPIVEGISCDLHIYNSSGSHIYQDIKYSVAENEVFDYEFNVTADNFTKVGNYAYVVSCNNSAVGGFAEVPFMVTPEGASNEDVTGIQIAMVLAYLGGALIFFLIGKALANIDPTGENRTNAWYQVLLSVSFYAVAIGLIGMGIATLPELLDINNISTVKLDSTVDGAVSFFTVASIILYVILAIVVLLSLINVLLRKIVHQEEDKKEADYR